MERIFQDLYKIKHYIDRREQELGSYMLGKKAGWLLRGYFPLGAARDLVGKLSNLVHIR